MRRLVHFGIFTLAMSAALVIGVADKAGAAPHLYPAGNGGTIRAFIVGIDDYTSKKRLQGAAADARDIESTLRELGVPPANMTVLIDQQATRKTFVAQMDRLVRETKAHDLVIISFAGHGAQMKEMHKNTKPDHLDEVYVLAKFDESVSTGLAERVQGPEMKAWLSKLDKKGADVLFIADTCHGGGLTRSVDPRQTGFSYRVINIAQAAEDTLQPESTPADALLTESSFSHVTFLAAVDRHSKAPEVSIAGQKTLRGALSYSVARALHGAADRAGQGAVTRRDLFEYANQVVLQFADSRQHPYYEPRREDTLDAVVFRTRAIEVTASTPEPRPESVLSAADPVIDANTLRVAVLNGEPSALSRAKPVSVALAVVADRARADFVWDASTKEALSGGDVVARNVTAEDVPWVADRIAAGRAIAALAETRPQTIRLLPDDRLHKERERLTLQATGLKGKHLIIFNLAGNGTVQYLFPREGDQSRIESDQWTLPFDVTPPFGVDQVVAIAASHRLTGLESALAEFDKRPAAGKAPGLLKEYLAKNTDLRIGLATIATAP